MLNDFFYTLRQAQLPISIKEYLTLLEALQAEVVGPNSEYYKLEDFYIDDIRTKAPPGLIE